MKSKPEKPLPLGARVYKRHRLMIRSMVRRLKKSERREISEAEVVRRALEAFDLLV